MEAVDARPECQRNDARISRGGIYRSRSNELCRERGARFPEEVNLGGVLTYDEEFTGQKPEKGNFK